MEITKRQWVTQSLAGRTFLTFGGNETYLLYLQKYPLREFCAFAVVEDDAAWEKVETGLLRPIAEAAAARGMGLLTDCLVWRASSDYVARLGYSERGVAAINQQAVARIRSFIERWRSTAPAARECPVIVAADVGPRGDGYAVAKGGPVSVSAAYDYHSPQVEALAEAKVDLVVALTMTSLNETLGIVRATERAGLPVLVSPTIETDGRVPDGTPLGQFVEAVDQSTYGYAVGHMANCAHPTHLEPTLRAAAGSGAGWLKRFRGLRANASAKTHAELDAATKLDRGDPAALGQGLAELQRAYGFTVVGGCCGTDAEHLRAVANACRPSAA
jgi:S-methylmethionine-dependent homocysteine/selenocysteine methylase